MAQPFAIRRLNGADTEDYRRIRLQTLATEPDFFGAVHEVEAARPLAEFTERLETSYFFGAIAEGRIVGVVSFRRETAPREQHKAAVHGFFVEPAWRGHGVAAALLAALVATAGTVVEQLNLTVVGGNRPAIALYEKFGFVTYGLEPRARKLADRYQDEILMCLRLQPD